MSSDEEEEVANAASYAARLSSLGGEGRRSSFGAKVSWEDISGEDGEIDRALSFSKPSEVPLFSPFKTCKNPEDGMFECIDEDDVERHVNLSEDLLTEARGVMIKKFTGFDHELRGMSEEEQMVLSKKYFLPERIEKITAEENGSRNLLVRTVLSHVVDKLDYAELIDVSVNQVLNSLMPMQDAGLDVDLTQAKSKTLKVLQKCVQAASEFTPAAAQKNVLSHSQIHFQETLKQLKLLYKSYVALDKQYSKAVKEHSEIVAELESEMLEGDEQDEKVVEA